MDQPAEQDKVSVLCTYDAELAWIAAEWLGDNKIPFDRRFDRNRGSSGTIELLVPASHSNKAFARLNEWRNFRESLPDAPIPTDPNYERVFKSQFLLGLIVFIAVTIIANIVQRDFLAVIPLVLIPFICAVAIRAYGYWRHLRALGYGWATLEDANDIIWRVGKKAYAIPSAVEAEILPGYNPDAAYIIRLLNSYYHPGRMKNK